MPLEGLSSLIKGLETQPSWQARRQFRQVVIHWPKSVGHAVARQTRPVSLNRNVLYVTVASAAWAQNLGFERTRILRKLNKHLHPPLRDLKFSTAQWSQKPVKSPAAISDELKKHPSYLTPMNPGDRVTARRGIPSKPSAHSEKDSQPKTADDAFQQWASLIQSQQKHQSTCPQCQCQCPPGELKRWHVCALCIAKTWV